MKKVFKYKINCSGEEVEIPSEHLLSATNQGDNVVVYALVDFDIPVTRKYKFEMFSTGEEIDDESLQFLGTVKFFGSTMHKILHVFYKAVD